MLLGDYRQTERSRSTRHIGYTYRKNDCMKRIEYPAKSDWANLLQRPVLDMEQLFDTVRNVIKDIRTDGDKAVIAMEEKFDKVRLSSLAVTDDEIAEAESLVSDELKNAIALAKHNIEVFHQSQVSTINKVETMPG